MTSKTVIGSLVLVVLGALAGCSETTSGDAVSASLCSADVSTKSVASNGVQLQGMRLNGINFNGMRMNGITLNGIDLNGVELNGFQLNGIDLNGPLLQGTKLNGIDLNGIDLNGPVLQGVQLNGLQFNGLTLNGSALQGSFSDGTRISTQALVGAKLVGRLSDGTTLPIFIDAVHENPEAKNADVVLYQISYGAGHEPLCGRDQGGAPVLATAIANSWDEKTGARVDAADTFTFACQGAALYKCVAAGYKPWKTVDSPKGPVSLADYHQACTRMIRADYCGDGTSYTLDGTLIDMADGLGIQSAETGDRADFAFEAAWGPDGAKCVSKTRYRLAALPQCLVDRMADTCDAPGAEPGSVSLMNRSASDPRCLGR